MRVIDSTKIGTGSTPVTGYVKFADPETLNSAAAFVAPGTIYVATDDGVVQALSVDTTTGALTRTDAQSITLPPGHDESGNPGNWYVAGLAASPDGKRLVVTRVFEHTLLVYDVDPTSPTFRQLLGQTGIGDGETFQVSFDPNDPTGQYAYVSMWADKKVLAGRREHAERARRSRRRTRRTWTPRAWPSSTRGGWSSRTTSATRCRWSTGRRTR